MVAVSLGGVVLAVDDSDPLGAVFFQQFDYLTPVETGAADVALEFVPGFVTPPASCVHARGGLWVGDDTLFIDEKRPSSILRRPSRPNYQARVRGNPLVEPTGVTIYYDESLGRTRRTLPRRIERALTVEFATPTEQLVRRVLKNLVEPLVHQRLLATGTGFVRASGAAHEDGAVLFAGLGGVGKSVLTSELLRTHEYAFVGDPLVVVDEAGTVYPYRKRLSVSPQSIASGEATYEQLMDGRTWVDHAQWTVRRRLGGPNGVRRSVLPSTQYAEWDPTRVELPLETVVTLVTADRDSIAVEATTAADVAARAAPTVAWQFRGYSDVLRASHAVEPGRWPCMEDLEERSVRLYERALAGVDTYLMYVPPDATAAQQTKVLFDEVLRLDRTHEPGVVATAV